MYQFLSELLNPFTVFWMLTVLGLGFLWRRRVESRRRLLWATVPLAGLTLASLPALAHLALLSLESRCPPQRTRPPEVQAIVVLSGWATPPDEFEPDGTLADDSRGRCLHAARLYRQGEPCLVLLSGGEFEHTAPGLSLAEMMRRFMVEQGVAEKDLILEERSRNTFENAAMSAELLRARGIERIELVTDALHLPRAERCFRAQGFDVLPAACRYRATRFEWSVLRFLPEPRAAKHIKDVTHEWLGLIWYRLRYGV